MIIVRHRIDEEFRSTAQRVLKDNTVDDAQFKAVSDIVQDCLNDICEDVPSIGEIINNIPIMVTNTTDTMATDGYAIYISPAYVYTIINQQGADAMACITYVLMHEGLHIVFQHCKQMADCAETDHDALNIAMDYEVNQTIEYALYFDVNNKRTNAYKGYGKKIHVYVNKDYLGKTWDEILKIMPMNFDRNNLDNMSPSITDPASGDEGSDEHQNGSNGWGNDSNGGGNDGGNQNNNDGNHNDGENDQQDGGGNGGEDGQNGGNSDKQGEDNGGEGYPGDQQQSQRGENDSQSGKSGNGGHGGNCGKIFRRHVMTPEECKEAQKMWGKQIEREYGAINKEEIDNLKEKANREIINGIYDDCEDEKDKKKMIQGCELEDVRVKNSNRSSIDWRTLIMKFAKSNFHDMTRSGRLDRYAERMSGKIQREWKRPKNKRNVCVVYMDTSGSVIGADTQLPTYMMNEIAGLMMAANFREVHFYCFTDDVYAPKVVGELSSDSTIPLGYSSKKPIVLHRGDLNSGIGIIPKDGGTSINAVYHHLASVYGVGVDMNDRSTLEDIQLEKGVDAVVYLTDDDGMTSGDGNAGLNKFFSDDARKKMLYIFVASSATNGCFEEEYIKKQIGDESSNFVVKLEDLRYFNQNNVNESMKIFEKFRGTSVFSDDGKADAVAQKAKGSELSDEEVDKRYSEVAHSGLMKNGRGEDVYGDICNLIKSHLGNDYKLVISDDRLYARTDSTRDKLYYITATRDVHIRHNFEEKDDVINLFNLVKDTNGLKNPCHISVIVGNVCIPEDYYDFTMFPKGFPETVDGNLSVNCGGGNILMTAFKYAPKFVNGNLSIISPNMAAGTFSKSKAIEWQKKVSEYAESMIKESRLKGKLKINESVCDAIYDTFNELQINVSEAIKERILSSIRYMHLNEKFASSLSDFFPSDPVDRESDNEQKKKENSLKRQENLIKREHNLRALRSIIVNNNSLALGSLDDISQRIEDTKSFDDIDQDYQPTNGYRSSNEWESEKRKARIIKTIHDSDIVKHARNAGNEMDRGIIIYSKDGYITSIYVVNDDGDGKNKFAYFDELKSINDQIATDALIAMANDKKIKNVKFIRDKKSGKLIDSSAEYRYDDRYNLQQLSDEDKFSIKSRSESEIDVLNSFKERLDALRTLVMKNSLFDMKTSSKGGYKDENKDVADDIMKPTFYRQIAYTLYDAFSYLCKGEIHNSEKLNKIGTTYADVLRFVINYNSSLIDANGDVITKSKTYRRNDLLYFLHDIFDGFASNIEWGKTDSSFVLFGPLIAATFKIKNNKGKSINFDGTPQSKINFANVLILLNIPFIRLLELLSTEALDTVSIMATNELLPIKELAKMGSSTDLSYYNNSGEVLRDAERILSNSENKKEISTIDDVPTNVLAYFRNLVTKEYVLSMPVSIDMFNMGKEKAFRRFNKSINFKLADGSKLLSYRRNIRKILVSIEGSDDYDDVVVLTKASHTALCGVLTNNPLFDYNNVSLNLKYGEKSECVIGEFFSHWEEISSENGGLKNVFSLIIKEFIRCAVPTASKTDINYIYNELLAETGTGNISKIYSVVKNNKTESAKKYFIDNIKKLSDEIMSSGIIDNMEAWQKYHYGDNKNKEYGLELNDVRKEAVFGYLKKINNFANNLLSDALYKKDPATNEFVTFKDFVINHNGSNKISSSFEKINDDLNLIISISSDIPNEYMRKEFNSDAKWNDANSKCNALYNRIYKLLLDAFSLCKDIGGEAGTRVIKSVRTADNAEQ